MQLCIDEHIQKRWNIIKDNPDKPWSWCSLSMNPNITWDIITNNPDKNHGVGII